MIAQIDDHFGKIMKTLSDCCYAENTVVIFTSDHGDMISERAMWFNKTLYEPAINVLLIIARPVMPPARVPRAISLLDIFTNLPQPYVRRGDGFPDIERRDYIVARDKG